MDDPTRDLAADAARLGIELNRRQLKQFQSYCALLLQANQRLNLTALKTPTGVMRTLILDSLTIADALLPDLKGMNGPIRVVDVGTGAGVPGIPLKILFPRWSMLLVESVLKKAKFVREVAEALDLADVSVAHARAEEVGAMAQHRDAADLCLARAVSALPSLLELCAPLVKVGGLLVFPKSGDVKMECDSAEPAARALKVRLQQLYLVPDNVGLGKNRFVVVYRKSGSTPSAFPRRVGLATSRPIGSEVAAEPPLTRALRSRSELKQRPRSGRE